MTTLPHCRQRGKSVKPGFYECSSNRLIHAIPGVASGSTCKICPYADRRNRFLLGDTVARMLKAVGIKKRANCGCGARQSKLNWLSIRFVATCKNWIRRVTARIVK